MRVVLADLKSNRGFVSKDTVVGGYGSRLDPFSRVTSVIAYLKKQFHDVPSVHMAYIAAILARAGHDVKWTRGDFAGRRRGARALLDRRPQERNRVGRRDARARREGRLHRHHGVEDARALRRSLRLHPERRAGSRRHADGADGRDPVRQRHQRADQRPRLAAVPAVGSRHRASRQEARHQVVVAAGRRRLSAAREPRLPGVLHVLPAPHSRRLPRAVDRQHRRRDRAAVRSGAPAVHHLPRSAVHRAARALPRAVRRDQGARPAVHVRGRNAARPARRRAARQARTTPASAP